MSSVLEAPPTIDGRELRSIRTRAAIIDAWLSLIDAGDLSPTAKGVADRAGIGLRTVFQHFSDMNALHEIAVAEQISRVMSSAADIDLTSSLDERIDEAVADRARIWEKLTPVRRASERQEWVSSGIHELIERLEHDSASSVAQLFAREFAAAPDDEQVTLALAVDAVICWSNWNHLRQRRGLTSPHAEAVMIDAVHRLLD